MKGFQITRLRISNFRGIARLDARIGPQGVIAQGGNGKGKTSVLRAIQAALIGRDVKPDAIRLGEDEAEILIHTDDFTVRRRIGPKGDDLVIVDGEGVPKSKPATWLKEMIGTAALDPIEFFNAKPPERRTQVLRALPISITEAQLVKWVGEEDAKAIIASGALKEHGLEVCERAYKAVYAKRTTANAEHDDAKGALDRIEVAPVDMPDIPVTAEDAKTAREKAVGMKADVDRRAERVQSESERTKSARESIESKRLKATDLRRQGQELKATIQLERAEEGVTLASAEVADLEAKLAAARERLTAAEKVRSNMRAQEESADKSITEANELDLAADDLASTLKAVSEPPVTDDDRAAVRDQEAIATALERAADETTKATDWKTRHDAALERFKTTKATAKALNDRVILWEKTAPAELLKGAEGIPGLTLQGEAILLDGVALDKLSGREQLLFAVEIARRANVKTKILIVDGIERVDPDHLDAFIAKATADGYQLIATRVDRGDMTLEAIETE